MLGGICPGVIVGGAIVLFPYVCVCVCVCARVCVCVCLCVFACMNCNINSFFREIFWFLKQSNSTFNYA